MITCGGLPTRLLLYRDHSDRPYPSGNKIINSNCGLGKSPGTNAARFRDRVIASHATPVWLKAKY